MSRLASQALLLGMIATMAALLAALWTHPAREALLLGGAAALIATSLLLERVWPQDPAWSAVPRAEMLGDVGSFVLVFGLIDGALKWLTPFVVLAVLPLPGGLALPLWQETVLVILWIEFAAWASHWAHHRFELLWALHAMHHSTERLYTLNNFRFHPLNHMFNHLAMILPLLAVGVSADAILIYSALSLPPLLLQHANVAFDFGRLNLVFNTNDLHRWHHSAKPSEGVLNLGRALVIWDQVFGTYLRRDTTASPSRIGLFDVSRSFPAPARFWAQLVWPFTPACCRTSA
jgi:sterol desaturase/sphingolipid hydroxylase (fatty acid hydroxylase superfamily)